MITDADIKRINELYHKRKEGKASEAEIAEHEELRKRYIESMRENVQKNLDNTYVQFPDGRVVKLTEQYKKKKDDK